MKNNTLRKLIKSYGKGFAVVVIFALIGAVVMGGMAKKKKTTTYTATRQIVIAHNISLFLIFIKSAEKVSDAREGDDGVLPRTPRSHPDADGALYALLLMR